MTPHEIRVTLNFFLEDLQEERYIDAVNGLIELYAYTNSDYPPYADRKNQIPFDKISELLQQHKTGIVKRLLRYMKHYDADEVKRFVLLAINALKHFGIDWPELAVMKNSVSPEVEESWSNKYKKSINCSNPKGFSQRAHCAARRKRKAGGKTKSKPVREALSSPLGGIVLSMQDALRKGSDAAVSHRVIDLWRANTAERQRASDMLADVEHLVTSYVERHLGSENHLDVQDGLNMLQVLPPSEDWADLQVLLNKYKTNILKYLLKCMKDNDIDIPHYRIPVLKKWGTDWPELDTIYTSADSELKKQKRIDEGVIAYHASPVATIRSKRFWPFTHFGSEKAAADRIKYLKKTGELAKDSPVRVYQVELNINNPAVIKDEPVQHSATQFAFALKKAKLISQEEMESITKLGHDPVTYKPTMSYADAEKQRNRKLRALMRSKGFDGFAYVNRFEDKGSMSYVILDPAQARTLRPVKAAPAELKEDERNNFSTVFRNRSEQEGGHRFTLNADEYVEHIEKLLKYGMLATDNVVIELATLGRRRPDAIKNWPELANLLNQHKDELMRIIQHHFNKDVTSEHAMARSVDVAGALKLIGIDWPEIAQLIEKNKHKIVKTLLEFMRDEYDAHIPYELKTLRSYGADWPELAVIEKSLNAGLNESKSNKLPQDVTDMVMDMLKRDGTGIALYHIWEWKLDIDKLPELEEFLNDRKQTYMEIMLKNMKMGGDALYGTEQYLERLEGTKINWPELKVIRNSLNKLLAELHASEEHPNENH